MRPEENVLEHIDFYKSDHRRQYPKGTEYVFSNLTPRRNSYGVSEKMLQRRCSS